MGSRLRAVVRWMPLGALCLFLSPSPVIAQDEGGGGDSGGESSSDSPSDGWSDSGGEGGGFEEGEDRSEDSSIWQSSSRGTSD